jgi:hypothetical protein
MFLAFADAAVRRAAANRQSKDQRNRESHLSMPLREL